MEFLHCKCESCTHWEIAFDIQQDITFLICKTCGLKLTLTFSDIDSHPMLHWSTKEE